MTGAPGTGVPELAAALRERLGSALCIQVLDAENIPVHHGGSESPAQHSTPRGLAPALTLLTGLDQPATDQPRAAMEAADAVLRTALAAAGMDFRVVYGSGVQRLEHALSAIKTIADGAGGAGTSSVFGSADAAEYPGRAQGSRPAWPCEKCSDPECEHKLFTSLVRTAEDSR